MAENVSELCTLLVQEYYGELSSTVFSTLVAFGRLTLNQILRHSGLTPKQVTHGLVVLIQQHLVYHYTSREHEEKGASFYEANMEQAYALVRSGKFVTIAEDRFGESAGGIISNLLLLGHAKVKDLADAYGVTSKEHDATAREPIANGNSVPNGVNGDHDHTASHNHIRSLEQLHELLGKLLSNEFIMPVRENQFYPPADVHNEAEEIVLRTQFPEGLKKSQKQISEFEREVRALKKKWRDEGMDESTEVNGVSAGSKRAADGFVQPSSKRIKLNKGYANGVSLLDENLILRINLEKFNVALRSQQFVSLAERSLGTTSSQVYEAVLRVVERKTSRCFDELEPVEDEDDEKDASPTVSNLEVASAIDPTINLKSGIKDDSSGANDGVNEDERNGAPRQNGTGAGALRANILLVDRHIRVLWKDPHNFAQSIGSGNWKVYARPLTRSLMQAELENTIAAHFGALGRRLIHILHDRGKLDEKQLANFALIPPRDIRSTLTKMQEVGFLETQEVPKDNSRQPSRTMYFWYFDQSRCRKIVLTKTYKSMARILQRMKVERGKVQSVIDKAERGTDAGGNEEKYLSKNERLTFRNWRETEEKLLVQLGRLDDIVALLRDFLPS